MANEQNLTHTLTESEQRKGGKKSGETRRKKKMLKECFEILLNKTFTDENGKVLTGAEATAYKVFEKALKGDLKAFEIMRDTAGQKPVDEVKTTQQVVDLSKFTTDEIKAMLDDDV